MIWLIFAMILTILQLMGTIAISWWWIVAIFVAPIAVFFCIAIFGLFIAMVIHFMNK